jgi:hypothetical protein
MVLYRLVAYRRIVEIGWRHYLRRVTLSSSRNRRSAKTNRDAVHQVVFFNDGAWLHKQFLSTAATGSGPILRSAKQPVPKMPATANGSSDVFAPSGGCTASSSTHNGDQTCRGGTSCSACCPRSGAYRPTLPARTERWRAGRLLRKN